MKKGLKIAAITVGVIIILMFLLPFAFQGKIADIVKTEGNELPDRTFEEAARLAAHYSKAREQEKAEIDYVQKKHIKKPNGAKPGFVVYYTNYSMTISTDITGIEEAE